MNQRELEFAAEAIRDADSVVALTGAGVSTASGIPDFRSADGIWSEYDPREFHVSRFRSDPEGFWRDRVDLVEEMFGDDVGPNAAHEALARLEAGGQLDGLITQNVDGLHQDAGSEDPVEIHGNGRRVACAGCSRRSDADPVFERARGGEVPPTCEHCGNCSPKSTTSGFSTSPQCSQVGGTSPPRARSKAGSASDRRLHPVQATRRPLP